MMLKNIACESNFIDNFMLKFRKTKLIKEVSFSLAKKNNSLNYVRINAKFSAYIPEAVEIFG